MQKITNKNVSQTIYYVIWAIYKLTHPDTNIFTVTHIHNSILK